MKKNNLIKIVKNKELISNIFKYEVILFPMGINNSMSNGLTYEISLNFPDVKEAENETGYGNINKLGTINETVASGISFVACYIHSGGYKKNNDGSFLNYDALEKCLSLVNDKYTGQKIATILLGEYVKDGGGNRDRILNIFKETITNCDITIYDYEFVEYKLKLFREIAEVRKRLKEKEITRKEYFEIRSGIEWRRKNGIFAIQPKDYEYIPKKNKSKLLFRGSKKQF